MTTIGTYDIGDVVRLACNIQVTAVDADPTVMTFKIRAGGGPVTTYIFGTNVELVKDSVGDYHVLWTVVSEQDHFVRWEGTGTSAQGAGESIFYVRDSKFY